MSMRTRPICVKVFGREHELVAAFPCSLATDLITLVEAFRRGKQPRLSPERVSAVETELSKLSSSLQALRHRIDQLKSGSCDSFDADVYYDASRVIAYSDEFPEVQRRHTARCLFLLGPIPPHSLALDLGCGSGLSTSTLLPHFGFTIGLDASRAMLSRASESPELKSGDFILADFNQPLPFRPNAFDFCSSTSALHYVKTSNTAAFLQNLLSVVRLRTGVQLFCREGVAELKTVWIPNWKGTEAIIVADKPHHKQDRFYMVLTSEGESHRLKCPAEVEGMGTCSVFGGDCACLLQIQGDWELIDGDHKGWLENEHGRHLNRVRRLKRRREELGEVEDV